ncbi:hypothetical protein [Acinetobacter sp. ANC 4173]|uniref:hypothetical protein n=1 Tax=Acinetobacter sp. ANC 4173 TaxID=2529837 RepID=UPI00103FEF7C|nr:hypothetical protein [Acinetobacter sp. ANC 4173]TCB74153.1 hypothetical protein E0H94_17595 [Acinetobacter sp. ANC 4173]
MANYTPPSGDNVVLNFKDLTTGSTELNFGVDSGTEPVAITATLDAVIDTSFLSAINALFDINFVLGVSHYPVFQYQKAAPIRVDQIYLWAKPIFKAHNSAFIFERGLTLSNTALAGFNNSLVLSQSIQQVFQQSQSLLQNCSAIWQENKRIRTSTRLDWNESVKLRIESTLHYEELIRKRKQITFSHEVAQQSEVRYGFEWDKGLELTTFDSIEWDNAKPIHYRKHPIQPWPAPEIPEYVSNTDLAFNCLCTDVESHNVILNFGVDDCIPAFAAKPWWYIVNEISVTRLDNGQNIKVLSGNYRTDRQSWCWSYTLVIPAFELSKLDPVAGQPVILKIMVNGFEHLMLLENRMRSWQLVKKTYTLTGRSPSALLDSPSSPPRAFLQENERTSVQLAQAEIDRSAYPDLGLNWQLIDALGWIIPTESFSYSGLTPIKAIQEIAAAAGGFVYSEANSQAITIKPLYKKTFWDSMSLDDYDILLSESIVTEQSTDYETYPDYNGISLTNDKTGATGLVKRTDTSGDVLLETVNNKLFTSASVMGSYGKSALAKAGMVETHTFSMPLIQEVGQCKPADILAFNAEWWGIVDSISGSFTYSKVTQTVTVERVNHE